MLAKAWGISLEKAIKTLAATTQWAVRERGPNLPSIRLRPLARQLMYRILATDMYVDFLQGGCVSKRGFKYMLVFCTPFEWVRVFPLERRSQAHEALSMLHQRYGVPRRLITDNAKEFVQGEFARKARQAGSQLVSVEPYTQRHNRAESQICELKRGYMRASKRTNSPSVL